MEIVKQSISQSNLFERHDHTAILTLLIFLTLSESHHTKFKIYLSWVHYLFSLFFKSFLSSNIFLHCDIKILRQMKKLLHIWWIDYSITLPISSCDSKLKGNIKSILLFLESCLEKIVLGPLVPCLVLSHSA